jgi:hypothetical protein
VVALLGFTALLFGGLVLQGSLGGGVVAPAGAVSGGVLVKAGQWPWVRLATLVMLWTKGGGDWIEWWCAALGPHCWNAG